MSALHLAPVVPHPLRGRWRTALVSLEALLSLNALVAGYALMTNGTHFDDATIEHLPFHSQRLGGLALFVIVGLVPAVAVVLDVLRHRAAPVAHLVVGPVTVGWILVQVAFIGWTSVLQPIVLAYGVLLAVLAARATFRPSR